MTKKSKIKFNLYQIFYTPESEDDLIKFTQRYNGNDKALVCLGGTIYTNYILNKINKEFDVYKKEK